MIIFKIYLDNKEINEKVNEYLDNNHDSLLIIQSEYILMNADPILNNEWKLIENWLLDNDIDYNFWKTI